MGSDAGVRAPMANYSKDRPVTVADLDQLRRDLLKEVTVLLNQKQAISEKRWLKSFEVRKLLNISPGTLQHLRDTGQIPYTRVGGLMYYEQGAIEKMLDEKR